jgi:MoCo/4Fe-4S cofactor protein with predicted Tat translocation signal
MENLIYPKSKQSTMQAKLPITAPDASDVSSVGDGALASGDSPTAGTAGADSLGNRRRGGYWRSIGELEGSPEFEQFLHREFPQAASEFPEGVSRRRWMKLMSASLALGGLAGCRYGPEEIATMVVRPPNTIPGVPKNYATNFELAGRAVHLLVSNLDGRPIKIEGNPQHPVMQASEPNPLENGKERFASAGTDVFSQACVLGLYDPDRAQRVAKRVEGELVDSSWEEFAEYASQHMEQLKSDRGASHAILMSPSLSPTVNRLVAETLEELPQASVAQYTSIDDSNQRAACAQVAGEPAEMLYDLSVAKVICCLDSDLLGNDPNMLLYSRQYAAGREPKPGEMSRMYAVESRFSVTGSSADARLAVRSSQMGAFIARLESEVDRLLDGGSPATVSDDEKAFDEVGADEQLERFVSSLAEDLVASRGAALVTAGAHLPVDVQVAALRINDKLESLGKSVKLMPSRTTIEGVEPISLAELSSRLVTGEIESVWVLGDNPVYTSPGDIELGEQLEQLEHVVYFAEFEDETAAKSSWSVPLAHALESWSDVRAVDGTYGIGQPQILPLLGGKSAIEILAILLGQPELPGEGADRLPGEELVRRTARQLVDGGWSSRRWRDAVHSGFMVDTASQPLEGDFSFDGDKPTGTLDLTTIDNGKLEVQFVVSDAIYDGRFAKNVWLQELPQAITKLVWDNAALVSPATADKLGLRQGEIVSLRHAGARLELPVFIVPGQAAGSIAVHLGYGRACRDEAVDSDQEAVVGQDVTPLRRFDSLYLVTDVEAVGTSRPYKLATTQDHFAIDDVGQNEIAKRVDQLVREATLEQFTDGGAEYIEHMGVHSPPLESLWTEPMETFEQDATVPYQWGMTIDLNKCTGCNACVVACQSENNVPVVGKEQVSRGREMHWIRVDRYFRGEQETPQIVNQPVTCMHCETAPCEQVCPVAATVHTDEEGINAMAYNRCVGTRYCANNCPYKVRRFNYFNYNTEYGYFYGWQRRGELEEASRKLQQLVLNPEVTVRGRGVMEKCTYCIQRIQNGKIAARREERLLADGEVQSACQAACPTQAIVFGDLRDTSSRVSQLTRDPRAYSMLAYLNTKPRTRYLIRVRNTPQRLKTA